MQLPAFAGSRLELPPVTDCAQPGYLLTLWQAGPQELKRIRDICDNPLSEPAARSALPLAPRQPRHFS
ncbi:MAG: hypothetical protein OXF32_09560 [Anaerolineaceae bacterium]|nr:hypothetical protein [Anaerolineaceae bacterium]